MTTDDRGRLTGGQLRTRCSECTWNAPTDLTIAPPGATKARR